MIAAGFEHWDTRTADPNLHTHVVIANKVQGPDGRWRSVDSRALHHAAVAVSELYDNLVADHLARALPVRWSWRPRGPRRTPAFEIDGIGDDLLAEFSTRSAHIDAAMREVIDRLLHRPRPRSHPGGDRAAAPTGHPRHPTGQDHPPARRPDRHLAAASCSPHRLPPS